MARRPEKEAHEIVRRAAEKMYPEYIKRNLDISNSVSLAVKVVNVGNLIVGVPKDSSLLANIPDSVDPIWWPLISEALAIPKNIIQVYGPKVNHDVKESKKWCDKMCRSLKKRGCEVL
jgi:hypothetical protein